MMRAANGIIESKGRRPGAALAIQQLGAALRSPPRHPRQALALPRSWLVLAALAGSFVFAHVAGAHPAPAATATLDLQADHRCELRITCDVSALVMQTMPGHLGKAAEELQALDTDELQARVDDAQQAIEYYVQLRFDGERQTLPRLQMPSLEVIRSGAAHGGEEAWPAIVVRGTWPADANMCEITFPAAIGRVQFSLVRRGETLYAGELAAGKSSGRIPLEASSGKPRNRSPGDWVGWVLVVILLAYLVRLYFGRPRYPLRPYSRSTNTGQ